VETKRLPISAIALMLFIWGFVGRIVLHEYHNFETIMVSVFLASMLLPIGLSLTITMSMIVLSDIYLGYFGNSKIIFFTYTGFLMISIITSKIKSRMSGGFAAATVYKFTGTGIIFAAIYDTWTNFGVFWLSYEHTLDNLILVYVLGIPFMIYHLLSNIVTFTLIGFPVYQILTKDSPLIEVNEEAENIKV
tara:strand:- start:2 stop:574 length:573 start_codon:yes stop_codon:yes gene_type:complete